MSSFESVEKELICPICADFFTNPKGLPCLHTFCRDCLKAHIMSLTDKLFITCPMCRKIVPIPDDKPRMELADVFPTNHQVISIMDIVVPKVKPVYCKICKERGLQERALKHCSICDENLCGNCGNLHRLFNATKSHTLNDLEVAKKSTPEETVSYKTQPSKVDYKISVSYKSKINVRTDKDDEPSFITGVIFLEDDRIVVTDNSNYKIKLFESDGKFVTEVCHVRPFGLTLVGQTDIAVTESGCIKFFQVHPNKIKLDKSYNCEWKIFTPRTLQISSSLRGLHYKKSQFVVCSGDDKDKHVIIFDQDGQNQRHFWKDEHFCGNMFKNPWYCCFSDELNEVYITDGIGISGCVMCLSYHGKKKWEYLCEMPRGIATVGDHILFADWRTDDVKVRVINNYYYIDYSEAWQPNLYL